MGTEKDEDRDKEEGERRAKNRHVSIKGIVFPESSLETNNTSLHIINTGFGLAWVESIPGSALAPLLFFVSHSKELSRVARVS